MSVREFSRLAIRELNVTPHKYKLEEVTAMTFEELQGVKLENLKGVS